MKYTGDKLREIVFPLGGIGTGSIGLSGNGALVDWEIFNRPNKGSINDYSFFAVRAEYPDGRSVVKVLQGDAVGSLMGQYTQKYYQGYGYGPAKASMCGFSHFRKVRFDGKFPIAELTFEDEGFPAAVKMKAFNPMIPLDADNSSIPAAMFEIKIHSKEEHVRYAVLFSVRNPFAATRNEQLKDGAFTAVHMIHHGKPEDDPEYGDLTVAVDHPDGICQEYWYRGRWQDGVTAFWRDLTDGRLENRHYDTCGTGDVCTVGADAEIAEGKQKAFRFVLTWNVPNQYNYWKPCLDAEGRNITWKNYYAVLFADSAASCRYVLKNWKELDRQTNRFCRSLHGSTLDPAVIDAVSSALSVLKSPTVLRLEDGTFYGWEGVHEKAGSCEGTCTHVWSYAYALCFLFPELERSLRDTELRYDTDEDGRMYFRTALPLGNGYVVQPPCVDGQMATIIKIYRDWKITGQSQWVLDHWEQIAGILDYAWSSHNPWRWDADRDGVLEGMQHHTLDMELFGPSAWLEGMYLAALKAGAELAELAGDKKRKTEYLRLFDNGYAWTKKHLFNGSYFIHKVDLQDRSVCETFNCPQYWNEEKGQLKYQIGDGCEIDQMLGQWHASICGLGDVFDPEQRKTALQSMVKNNFKPSLREVDNMWRVFALNDEGGTIICDYPEGIVKPIIPIPYCEECMTGFEYAFAGLLISEGLMEEGLEAVRAIRNRYDGQKRNPWNEIECGSNYARPMANFALLPIFSGMSYDLPRRHIGFMPILSGGFRCLWSLGTGWGDFVRSGHESKVVLAGGSLELESIALENAERVQKVIADGCEIAFKQKDGCICFEPVLIRRELKLITA